VILSFVAKQQGGVLEHGLVEPEQRVRRSLPFDDVRGGGSGGVLRDDGIRAVVVAAMVPTATT